MDIKKIIKEELEGWEWTEGTNPSNLDILTELLGWSDFEVVETQLKNRVFILYYGIQITSFIITEGIDGWLENLKRLRPDYEGDKYEEPFLELYELLKENYNKFD